MMYPGLPIPSHGFNTCCFILYVQICWYILLINKQQTAHTIETDDYYKEINISVVVMIYISNSQQAMLEHYNLTSIMTPHILNTIPQAASLGPQNKSDGILPENDHRLFLSNLGRNDATSEVTASLSPPLENHRDECRQDSVIFVYCRYSSAILVGMLRRLCAII